jgi:hypothetical protein
MSGLTSISEASMPRKQVDRLHHPGGLLHLRALEAEGERHLPRLERREPDAGMDVLADDPLWRGRGHLFDVHAAGLARHEERALHGAIDEHAQVELAADRDPLFDEHARDHPAFGPGLVGHERHADHVARDAGGLVGALGELHAAALPAPARVNLGLDDDRAASEAAGDLPGLVSGERDLAAGHGHTEPREEGLGLMFVDVHGERPSEASRRLRTRARGEHGSHAAGRPGW